MITLSAILFWFFVALAAILVGVLITPVSLRLFLRTSPQWVYRVDARILGGLTPNMPVVDSSRPRKPRAKRQKKKKARSGRKNQVFGRKNIVSALPKLLFGIIGAIHFKHLSLDVEFGLYDPADTGQLYGYLTPLQYSGCMARDVSISLRPNFEHACIVGEVDASVRVTAASLLVPIFRFGWSAFGLRK